MTISDANPVQFWLIDCDTFNEKSVSGVFSKCFSAPFNLDDTITIQFISTSGLTYGLTAIDSQGVYMFTIAFTEVNSGVYQASFIPRNYEFTEEEYQFFIYDSLTSSILAPSAWSNAAGDLGGVNFTTRNSTEFIGTGISTATGLMSAKESINIPSGITVRIPITVTVAGTFTGGVNISMFMMNSAGSSVVSTDSTDSSTQFLTAPGTYEIVIILTATANAGRLYLQLSELLTSGTANVTITPPVGYILYIEPEGLVAKSDPITIREEHDETVLITYHNNRVFASLSSSAGTPDPEFNLRIPAVFFEERFPEESEVLELSDNSNIQLSAEVKYQKLLEVKLMPYYMHLKTKLVLKFQNVIIDGEEWVNPDGYDVGTRSNRRFPLVKGSAWLTRKDYLVRNIL